MNIVETLAAFKRDDLDGDAFLRAVVEYPSWQVVVDERQHPAVWTVGGEDYIAVMAEPAGPGPGPHRYLEVGGRHLARNLPKDVHGAGFEMGRPHGLGLGRDEWPRLLEWAAVVDLEEAIEHPAPDQGDDLLAARFLVLCSDEAGPVAHLHRELPAIRLFTAEDAARRYLEREAYQGLSAWPMTLRQLAELLGDRRDFDALWVNAHQALEWDPWPPSAADDLQAGRDPRPEARILKARSIAEIHAFLDQESVATHDRRHVLEYWGDTLVARYEGSMLGRRAKVYRFEPVTPGPDPLTFGEGASELLCAGYLLETLERRLGLLPDSPTKVGDDDRDFVAETARLAWELEKLLGDGDQFPRRVLRTTRGARFVRERFWLAQRSWVHAARARVEALAGTA